jgi:toxin ParE1/3/4
MRLWRFAQDALMEQAEYIGRDSPDASDRFLDAAVRTFAQLEKMPGMGRRYESPHLELSGVRVWSVKGFRNYLIFYRAIAGGIEVIAVLHGARDIPTVLSDAIQSGDL